MSQSVDSPKSPPYQNKVFSFSSEESNCLSTPPNKHSLQDQAQYGGKNNVSKSNAMVKKAPQDI